MHPYFILTRPSAREIGAHLPSPRFVKTLPELWFSAQSHRVDISRSQLRQLRILQEI